MKAVINFKLNIPLTGKYVHIYIIDQDAMKNKYTDIRNVSSHIVKGILVIT